MVLIHLLIYLVAFFFIWFGSGLIVASTSKFSHKLRLSPFAFSFVFLGLLTSIPEFSVGLQSLAGNQSEIFVGNLLGGILVLFLVVIPLLAIFGNGIKLHREMDRTTLLVTLGTILAPSFFILDKRVTILEGVVLVVLYCVPLLLIERKKGIFDKGNAALSNIRAYSYRDFGKILIGIAIVFVASTLIVEKTLYFSEFLGISTFYISLLVVAIGTDLPELSIAVRSVLSGKREIAMGDYIGAAAASTLMFGIFTLLHHGELVTADGFGITFFFTFAALFSFLFLSLMKDTISRLDGFVLLGFYVLFVALEVL